MESHARDLRRRDIHEFEVAFGVSDRLHTAAPRHGFRCCLAGELEAEMAYPQRSNAVRADGSDTLGVD